jgi:cytosine permease
VVAGDGNEPDAASMTEKPRLTKDYTNAPVPDEATIHGLRIGIVVAGIGATLPMFLLGSQIAVGRGLRLALPVCFAACSLVGLLGALTSIVGSRSRLSTYQVVAFSFGIRGAQLVNLVLGVMLIGWFATTGDMLGAAIQHAVAGIHGSAWPHWVYTVGALTAMTLTGIFGFRVMERFVRVTVPLLTILMAYVVWLSLQRGGLAATLARPGNDSLSTVDAVSSVIGAIILTAVLAPDLTRYARNDRHALLSELGLVIGFPTALIMAAIPAAVFGEGDVMKVMTALNIPGIAIVILVMSTWTSNTSNLYSSTLTLATFFKRSSSKQLGFGAALAALAAALLGIADHFIPVLIVLGVISAPLAGVYVVDFFGVKHQRYDSDTMDALPAIRASAFAAWILGSIAGLAGTYYGYSVTSIPAVDSILIAALAYFIMNGGSWRHLAAGKP